MYRRASGPMIRSMKRLLKDPSQITYIQHEFRNHLLSCIEAKNLTKFPSHSRTRNLR